MVLQSWLWIYTLREKLTDIRMSNSVENKKLKDIIKNIDWGIYEKRGIFRTMENVI